MNLIQQHSNRPILPIGMQSFGRIREISAYYVDKTALISRLINEGDYYFLSRPRRFGKSLLVDTLNDLFEGREQLFQGLAIHQHWDWSIKYPVIRLSFGGGYQRKEELEEDILDQLAVIESDAGLQLPDTISVGQIRLRRLIHHLHRTQGQPVVVLVDEYDKPILDVLDNPELAKENRDYLRGFYGIIKDSARHVRFVFVTGITMFSKVSLFSGLNNLKDISLDPRYASICGFTDEEIDTVFAAELEGLDRQAIRRWYNGYHWRGEHKLYNPWDILSLFDRREFAPYWFNTAIPTYLYQLLETNNYPVMELEGSQIKRSQLTQFDIEKIDLRALMFQSGYLTIAQEYPTNGDIGYTLEYPNFGVRTNFNTELLDYFGRADAAAQEDGRALLAFLEAADFEGFAELLRAVYADIPHQWYRKNELDRYEGHYLSVLYAHFNAVGAEVRVEESSSRGQSDLVVRCTGQVVVMEAKVVEGDGESQTEAALSTAMQQMKARSYADKYRGRDESVYLMALVFGATMRNLVSLKTEVA